MVHDTSFRRRPSHHRPLWISNQVSFSLLLHFYHASLIWLLQCCRKNTPRRTPSVWSWTWRRKSIFECALGHPWHKRHVYSGRKRRLSWVIAGGARSPPPPVRFYVYGAVIPAQGIEPRLIGPLALAEHHRPFLGLKWTYQSTCGKWQFLGL